MRTKISKVISNFKQWFKKLKRKKVDAQTQKRLKVYFRAFFQGFEGEFADFESYRFPVKDLEVTTFNIFKEWRSKNKKNPKEAEGEKK